MKRTPLKRKKGLRMRGVSKTSLLKRKLWKVFSLWVKKRDKNICFTCGRNGKGKGIHAGHFVPKSVGGLALYFNEDNVHAQCYHCNINLGGNQYIYGKKLGDLKVDELLKLRNQITRDFDFESLIKKYERR